MSTLQTGKISELHTKSFWLTPDGRLEVYSPRMATKLNKVLKVYEGGKYTFAEGEEALFRLTSGQVNQVMHILAPRAAKATGG